MQERKISRKEAVQRHGQFAVKRRCPRHLRIDTAQVRCCNGALHERRITVKDEIAVNIECPVRRKRARDGRSAGRADPTIPCQRAGLVRINIPYAYLSAVGDRQEAGSARAAVGPADVKPSCHCPLRGRTIHCCRAV